MSKAKATPVQADKSPKEEPKHDNGFRGVSAQGVAQFVPGTHPKSRQLDEKAKVAEAAPAQPSDEEDAGEGNEEHAA
jgi:hypothetical protein